MVVLSHFRSCDDEDDIIMFLLKGMQGAEEHGSLYYRYRNKCKYASEEQKNEDETV